MSYSSEVLADSPTAYYRLADVTSTAVDSSGNSRNGTFGPGSYTQSQTSLIPTDANNSTLFAGGNVGVTSGSWQNTTSFTAEAWVNINTVPSAVANFTTFAHDNNGANLAWRMGLTRHDATHMKLFCLMQPAVGAIQVVVGSTAWIVNTTHHIVATYDGTNLKVYVDGVLDGTTAFSGAVKSETSGILIGSTSTGSEATLGIIDECAVYGTALSSARILAHFNAATTSPPGTPTGLSVDPGVTNLELSWSALSGSPDGYDVRIDGGSPVDAGNVLSYDFTGLDPGTNYTLEVRAYNSAGDSAWASISQDTDDLPAPTGLTILGDDEDTLTLGWDTHTYATGFEVRIDGGTPEDVGLTTLHVWDFLDPDTMYELEVRAYMGAFFSDWSSIDGDTGEPPPPTGEYIVHLVVGSHEWFIAWDDVLDPDDPVQVLDGLKIGWDLNESDPWPTQPSPVTCEVGFYSTDVAELDADLAIGTPMYAVIEDGDGNEFATFHGRLTEAQAKPIKRRAGLRMLYTIKGDDYTVDLDEEPVTIVETWPAETADDRFARIAELAATVGLVLEAPADTGTAAFEELTAATTTIGDLVHEHLRQIVIPGPARYVIVPVMDGNGLLDHFECALLENEVDAGILPGTFAIVDGVLTLVFPDPEADGVVDAGDVDLDTTWTRLKFRAFNRVRVASQDFAVETSRPGPPVRLDLSTTLTDVPTAELMAELYLPDTDEALGWVADRFLFYAHRHQEGLLPTWFPDHREDPPNNTPYIMPLVMLRIPGNINLAGTTALAGQLSKAELEINRRRVEVGFALRRQLPTPTGGDGASWEWAYDTFPSVDWDDIDPELSWYEARLGRAT